MGLPPGSLCEPLTQATNATTVLLNWQTHTMLLRTRIR